MLFLVEDGKAFDHITSLKITGNRGFTTTSISLLGKSCYVVIDVFYLLYTGPGTCMYVAESLLK